MQNALFGHQDLSGKGETGHAQSGWGRWERVIHRGRPSERFRGYDLEFVPWGVFGYEAVWKRRFGRVGLRYTGTSFPGFLTKRLQDRLGYRNRDVDWLCGFCE